jgi:hypothetical protein
MHDIQKNEKLRDEVHLEMGEHVLGLQNKHRLFHDMHVETATSVLEMKKERNIVKKLHMETVSQLKDVDRKVSAVQRDVAALQTGTEDMRNETDLHTKLHLQFGEDMKKIETRINDVRMNSDKATKRSVEKNKTALEEQKTAALSTKSFASAGDVDVRKLRSDLDAALAKLKVQENMCMSTSNIVKGLGEKMLGRKAASPAASPVVDREKHMLAMLQSDLASSNTRGQNRRK